MGGSRGEPGGRMPKQFRIIGLDDFGLTTTTMTRLGARAVRLSIHNVWGVVAIQIEGQVKGSLDLEDRLMLVKANDPVYVNRVERDCDDSWRPSRPCHRSCRNLLSAA